MFFQVLQTCSKIVVFWVAASRLIAINWNYLMRPLGIEY